MNDKPIPLKVFGRSHYACQRCKISKMRCSGEKPACANCIASNKKHQCVYPAKDRKIMLMESDLDKLHERVSYLEGLLQQKESSSYNQQEKVSSVRNTSQPQINYSQQMQQQQIPQIPQQPQPQQYYSNISDIQQQHHQAHLGQNSTDQVEFNSPIQHRVQTKRNPGLFDYSLEDFLLPDRHIESLQWNINLWEHPLPPKEQTLLLLETVHRRYSMEFYVIDFDEVLRLIDEIYTHFHQPAVLLRHVSHVSLCYFYVILAFGAQQLHPETSSERTIPGIDYFIIASQLFNLAQEELDIHFIQSALLLALYAANLNRYNTVYNYFGVASRASVAMGLHRQRQFPPSSSKDNSTELLISDEKTKRLWWTVFVIDTTWAAKMNMPVHIDYTDTDVDLPLDNVYSLNDEFDCNILESNVHLAKYISKFVRIIYGPKIRTFSINYINTDQFNQRLLIKNILECWHDLMKNLEPTILAQYDKNNIVQSGSRRLTNLFLRYHQLIVLITKPLLSLTFNKNATTIVRDPHEIEAAIFKGIHASCASIDMIYGLYNQSQLFTLGFWDSQHLYSSMLMLIMSGLTGRRYLQLQKGAALLNYMADKGNINAQNSVQKLRQVVDLMNDSPNNYNSIHIDLNLNMKSYNASQNQFSEIDASQFFKFQQSDEEVFQKAKLEVDRIAQTSSPQDFETFKNYFLNHAYLSEPIWRELQTRTQTDPLVILSSETNISENTQNYLNSIIRRIQKWDDMKWFGNM
ncbi:hypothetical protein CAAN1_12S01156 [[Candida] anglica]|uniref:Zn(2)-C6 fungal-type domain-containing protein n=1 Tax=[Candida] anglica TaxID=148631 RepID=A0ABP0E7D9_9ASCO